MKHWASKRESTTDSDFRSVIGKMKRNTIKTIRPGILQRKYCEKSLKKLTLLIMRPKAKQLFTDLR